MPTYQYACTECGHQLEAVQSFSDPALTECPTCQGKLRKVFNSVGIVFKGSGFYRNDSRANGTGAEKAADGAKKAESSPSTESSSGTSSSSPTSTPAAASASSGSGSSGAARPEAARPEAAHREAARPEAAHREAPRLPRLPEHSRSSFTPDFARISRSHASRPSPVPTAGTRPRRARITYVTPSAA